MLRLAPSHHSPDFVASSVAVFSKCVLEIAPTISHFSRLLAALRTIPTPLFVITDIFITKILQKRGKTKARWNNPLSPLFDIPGLKDADVFFRPYHIYSVRINARTTKINPKKVLDGILEQCYMALTPCFGWKLVGSHWM